MYHEARLYDLSFVSSKRKPATNPQIVFTIEKKHLPNLIVCLERLVQWADVESYAHKHIDFCLPVPDLFGNVEFGYGACGFVKEAKDEVSLYIELCEKHLANATMTINLLTQVLCGAFNDEVQSSNRKQQVDLETCCMNKTHGHAVGGYISGEVREWLRKLWHKGPNNNWMHFAPAPQEVIRAMRQTWSAVASKDLKRWTKDCNGAVTEDGRFILNCIGDACDLAIYPDNVYADDYGSVRFSCHNLDGARQQLTLLAGLAKLCELARAET